MLPNHAHGYTAGAYMQRRRWDYFVRYLMGAEPPKEYQMGTRAAGAVALAVGVARRRGRGRELTGIRG